MSTTPRRTLKDAIIFDGLPADTRLTVENKCTWLDVRTDATIVNYLDVDDSVYFLVSGSVRLNIYAESGKTVWFGTLGPGEVFGELAAFDGQPRSANVEALEGCLIARLPARDFRHILTSESIVAANVCAQMAKRIRDLNTRIYEFSTLAVHERVQAELLRLSGSSKRTNDVSPISPTPKHADIASRISTHREAVSRELSRLKKEGVISKSGNAIYITDRQSLVEMVQDSLGEKLFNTQKSPT